MRLFTQAGKSESGIALVTALLTLLVLSTLSAAFIFVSQTETWTSANYKALTQGRYLAEAGVERTLNWMRYNYTAPSGTLYTTSTSPVEYNGAAVVLSGKDGVTANYPDSATQSSFNSNLHNQSLSTTGLSGSYSTSATLLQFRNVQSLTSTTPLVTELWRTTSDGTVTGVRGATVQVEAIMERRGDPVFNYALSATGTGCGVVNIASPLTPGVVDSWDSSKGTYADTKQSTGGDVGSNGNVILAANTTIYGTLSTPMPNQATGGCLATDPNALTTSGAGLLKESKIKLPQSLTFENPPAITPAPPTTSQSIDLNCPNIQGCSGTAPTFYLAPGTYGNLALSGGTVVLSAGVYNVNSIGLTGGSKLQINSGPVRINVAGASLGFGISAINMSAGVISNTTGLPINLAFIYGGTASVRTSTGTGAYAVIYAPNAQVTISGNSDWYGSIVAKKFTAADGSSIHYDATLREDLFLRLSWRVISMSRNKY